MTGALSTGHTVQHEKWVEVIGVWGEQRAREKEDMKDEGFGMEEGWAQSSGIRGMGVSMGWRPKIHRMDVGEQ